MSKSTDAMCWRYTPTPLTITGIDDLIQYALAWTTSVTQRGEIITPRVFPTPTGCYVLARSPYRVKEQSWDVWMAAREDGSDTARLVYHNTHDRKGDAEAYAKAHMRAEWPEGESPKWVRRDGK